MCARTQCQTCQKYTWAGCGQHLQSVFNGISADMICTCPRTQDALKKLKK